MGSENTLKGQDYSIKEEAELYASAEEQLKEERAAMEESIPEGPLRTLALGLTDACLSLSAVLHEAVGQNNGQQIAGATREEQVIANSFGTAALAVSDGVQAITRRKEVAEMADQVDGVISVLTALLGPEADLPAPQETV